MGIVYVFLTLLVWVMNRSSQIVRRFNYILPDDEPKKKIRVPAPAAANDDAAIAIALAAVAARS
jgi:sodium pump decarboxylase gamma subunit